MNFYLHRIPFFIKWFYPEISWNRFSENNTIYLTFDDGPHPEVTNFVLNQLESHQAKATFFCLGANIQSHPDILSKIIENGHKIGNHTFDHLDGWKSTKELYLKNIEKCSEIFVSVESATPKVFRPPYGRIKKNQIHALKLNFDIILWDYLIGDFDGNLSKEKCWKKAKKNIRNGDIVVFHDNEQSFESLKFVLPKFLKYFSDLGFEFKSL